MTTPAPRCVCGDPIEWMDGDGGGWIHSPGSDTRCLNARPQHGREMIAAELRAAAQAIEDSDGMNDDPLTDAIWAGAKEQRALNVIDKPTALAVLAYRHLADRIAQGEPAGARLALVTADDLAEILDYVVGDGDVRVVRNETLDRAFAALKATLPRGEAR